MEEGFFEIISIFVGRYIFGFTGLTIRRIWDKFTAILYNRSKKVIQTTDMDDLSNRIIGFIFLGVLVIFAMLIT